MDDDAVTLAPLTLRDYSDFAPLYARHESGDPRAFLLRPTPRFLARDADGAPVGYGWRDDDGRIEVRGDGAAALTARLTEDAQVRAGDAAAVRRRLEGCRVSIVPYSHADWAWVHTRHWHERRYALVFGEALDRIAANPDFRWYFDNAACQFSAFAQHNPERIPELRRRVAEGKVAICGAYSNVRPHMVGDESFVRNLTIGRRFWEANFPGADLSVHGDAVDVATGHSQLPQLLTQAGYRYLRIWRPYGQMSLKGIPNEFVWRGADGSEILTSRGLYGGQWYITDGCQAVATPREGDWDDVFTAFWRLDIEERSRYSVAPHLWIAHGADDARPGRMLDDTPFDIEGLMARWNENETTSTMRFATPVEQFADLEAVRAELPTIAGPLDTCDVAYNAAWNGEKGLAVVRIDNDRRLVQAETFAALASLVGFVYPEAEFEALWKDHLLTCAHATQWLYRADFAYIRGLAEQVTQAAERIRDAALTRLTEAAALPDDAIAVVFNPVATGRSAPVTVHLSKFADRWPLALADADGNVLETQVVDASSGQGGFPELEVVANVELPPLGMAVLRAVPAETVPSANPVTPVMDNGTLRLTFDDAHRIAAISGFGETHPASDTEWGSLVLSRVAVTQGPLHVGPIVGEEGVVWESIQFVESGPVRWRCVRKGSVAGIPVALTTTLHAKSPQVDFELNVDWPGLDGFLGVRVPLPENAKLWADIPFGIESRDPDHEPYGADHRVSPHSMERTREGLFYAKSAIRCSDSTGMGIALISQNTDRYWRKLQGQNWLEHLLINSVVTQDAWEAQVEQSTLVGRGPHTLRWSLKLCPRFPYSELVRQPPLVRPVRRSVRAGDGAPTGIAAYWVNVSAIYREGDHWIVRVYNPWDRPFQPWLELPFAPTSVEAIDLLGHLKPGAEMSLDGRTLNLKMAPAEVRTLRLGGPA